MGFNANQVLLLSILCSGSLSNVYAGDYHAFWQRVRKRDTSPAPVIPAVHPVNDVHDEYIVKIEDSTEAEDVIENLAGAIKEHELPNVKIMNCDPTANISDIKNCTGVINLPHLKLITISIGGNSSEIYETLTQIQLVQGIEYIEENEEIDASDCLSRESDSDGSKSRWGLDLIDANDGNAAQDNTLHFDENGGENVRVYIIDSGIQTDHLEFGDRVEWGKIFQGLEEKDDNGHGTHVAGIAIGNSYGVARKAEGVAVKVLDSRGRGKSSNVVSAIYWVIADMQEQNTNDASTTKKGIINMSLTNRKRSIQEASKSADEAGIVVVVSAENDGIDYCLNKGGSNPSAIITVGAIDSNLWRWSYSNYGSCVDIFAPGVGIFAAYPYAASVNNLYDLDGTSQAAPMVVGAVATYLSQMIKESLNVTNADVKEYLYAVATYGIISNIKPGSPNRLLQIPCPLVRVLPIPPAILPPIECDAGYWGTMCEYECFCADGAHCNRDNGKCPENECMNGYKGKTCNYLCNATLTIPYGRIESPNFPDKYENNENCTWIINATSRIIVYMRISAMKGNTGENCYSDYVEVFDGRFVGSTVLGKLCGKKERKTLPSTGTYLRIQFITNHRDNDEGFFASYKTYESRDAGCNLKTCINGGHCIPSIWGYACKCRSNYKARNCDKVICLNGGTYKSSGLENYTCQCPAGYSGQHCQKNTICDCNPCKNAGRCVSDGNVYLCICDDGWRGENCQHPTCGGKCQNGGTCYYTGDGNFTQCLCSPQYFGDTCDEGCGGNIILKDYRVITSPFYPDNYTNNLNCTWYISVPDDHKQIVVGFISIDIRHDNDICMDSLEILGTWDPEHVRCGSYQPTNMYSLSYSSNNMRIRFISNGEDTAKGFSLYVFPYDKQIVAQYLAYEGQIMSPNYPYEYPRRAMFMWKITIPDIRIHVNLTFYELKIENSEMCKYDWLAISTNDDRKVNQYFCGIYTFPSMMVVKSSKVTLHFFSDYAGDDYGFNVGFNSAKVTCGGNIYHNMGTLSSPNYPLSYPTSITCNWIITLSINTLFVNLIFHHFELHDGPACNDWLSLKGVDDKQSNKLCGKYALYGVYPTNIMWIRFRSDHENSKHKGFSAKFESSNLICGGKVIASSGLIQSPNYPNEYYTNEHCRWEIILPNQWQYIELSFQSIDIEIENGHCYDSLEITTPLTDEVIILCGTAIPATEIYNSYKIFVKFESDNMENRNGFRAKFKSVDCPGDIFSVNGLIEYPTYPWTYPRDTECHWRVIHPNRDSLGGGVKIRVTITALDIDWSEDCQNSYLRINSDEQTTFEYICGLQENRELGFYGKLINVWFKSGSKGVGKGFKAKFEFVVPDEFWRKPFF